MLGSAQYDFSRHENYIPAMISRINIFSGDIFVQVY